MNVEIEMQLIDILIAELNNNFRLDNLEQEVGFTYAHCNLMCFYCVNKVGAYRFARLFYCCNAEDTYKCNICGIPIKVVSTESAKYIVHYLVSNQLHGLSELQALVIRYDLSRYKLSLYASKVDLPLFNRGEIKQLSKALIPDIPVDLII